MPATFQYWRVTATSTTGAAVLTLAELVFFDTNNSVISLAGGTASASTNNGNAGNAFDGSAGSTWSSTVTPTGGTPQWIQYQFTGAVPVVAISILIVNVANAPTNFIIQSSPNGTTWTTQATISSYYWYPNQLVYFSASTVVGNLRATQVPIEVVKTGNSLLATQVAVEVLANLSPDVKNSQLSVEVLLNKAPDVLISQMAIEILYPYTPKKPLQTFQFVMP